MRKREAHALDLTGQRFGRWLVIDISHRAESGDILWKCRCDCGTERPVRARVLRHSNSKSCGCLHREKVTTHGYTATPTFQVWQAMRQRCHYPKAKSYKHYGGRGIIVCQRWRDSFENFVADMGEKPEGKSLDRIDKDGPYSPENCRWATGTEQARNRPSAKLVTLNGVTKNVYDWANEVGISPRVIRDRMSSGWSAEEALFRPVDKRKASKKSRNIR